MKVRLVCYEDLHEWILGKFALRMQQDLLELGVEVDIAKIPDPNADINHHIIYEQWNGEQSNNDTLMITHIDSTAKLNHLKKFINNASYGICMSEDTMNLLSTMGVPRDKLCYVNPAHDGDFEPRKIQIGYTSRWYSDGRKREYLLRDLANHLNNRFFAFQFMGSGWDNIVNLFKDKGFEVNYFPDFDLKRYKQIMSEIDYYLYTGLDEGQMGYVDALASGVKTIVTPQGYHLDVKGGLIHSFKESKDLLKIFDEIYEGKAKLIKSVETWTWKNYTLKHLELWNHILENQVKLIDKFTYDDGIFSLNSKLNTENESLNRRNIKRKLYFSGIKRSIIKRFYYYRSKEFWKYGLKRSILIRYNKSKEFCNIFFNK